MTIPEESVLYQEEVPNIKGLNTCTRCKQSLVRDIFQIQLEKGKKLIDAIACDQCKIIYEVLA